MKINRFIKTSLLLLLVQLGFAQNKVSKEISGQIFEQSTVVDGVNIVNNNTTNCF